MESLAPSGRASERKWLCALHVAVSHARALAPQIPGCMHAGGSVQRSYRLRGVQWPYRGVPQPCEKVGGSGEEGGGSSGSSHTTHAWRPTTWNAWGADKAHVEHTIWS